MLSCNIEYTCNKNYLNENEWRNVIRNCISVIKGTQVGSILLNKINRYISSGNILKIKNYVENKSFQYPHVNYKNINTYSNLHEITICIPDTPYFTKVPIISPNLSFLANENELFHNIYNQCPVKDKLDQDFVRSFSEFHFQPIVVVLFHELVHVLRYFMNISDDTFEEEATMYGIIGKTLIIDGFVVTENTFRKELNLFPRISHSSEYLHVDGTLDYDNKKPKSYWKSAFNKINLN